MTLITAGNSNGVYGQCDEKCHNAKNPKCQCICGGRYHGKKSGSAELLAAVQQTESGWIHDLEWDGAGTQALLDVKVNGFPAPRPVQEELFDEHVSQ